MLCNVEKINPRVTNRLSHSYQLDESTSVFRGIGGNFSFVLLFSIGLPMSQKKDAILLNHFKCAKFVSFCTLIRCLVFVTNLLS